MAVNLNSDYRRVQLPQRQSSGLDFDAARKRMLALQVAQREEQQRRAAEQTMTEAGFPVSEPQTTRKSFQEKILSLTGGNILGRGLGLGLAQGGTKKTMDEIQAREGDMQQKLISAIQKNRKEGKDTSRLVASLKALTGGIAETGDNAKDLYTEGITSKQVVGDAAQLATTAVAAAKLPGMAKSAIKPGVVAGVKAGVKTGAKVGTGFGAASGFSQGLKDDKSIGASLKQAGVGALTGAVTGAVVGGVAGGVAGKLKARAIKSQTKESDFALSLVSPKATEKMKIQALKEGRVTEQGLLKASKILPSKRDNQLAEAVKDVVSTKMSPAQNLVAIENKVDEINTGVKAYVKVNKVPFNGNQLRAQLNKGKDELNLVFASDKQAEKTYDAVVKEFMKRINNKDTSGLFQVRQEFDNIPAIKKLLDSQGLGENTKKEVTLTVRNMANRYIASLLPKGNKFRETLLRESKMIEAMGNIAEKNSSTIGLNRLQVWDKKYPILRWFVGIGVGAGGVGVGSTIIGSSD